jgi:low temperature requirement protein LtrA
LIYFDRGVEAARRVISAAIDPGRLAVWACTYLHVPIVAGVIAVGADELTIPHARNAARSRRRP